MPERQDPSLFDEVEPDGTRTPGIFRAPPPTKARRRTPLLPPPAPPRRVRPDAVDVARTRRDLEDAITDQSVQGPVVEEIVRRWEARVAAALARMKGTDRA